MKLETYSLTTEIDLPAGIKPEVIEPILTQFVGQIAALVRAAAQAAQEAQEATGAPSLDQVEAPGVLNTPSSPNSPELHQQV